MYTTSITVRQGQFTKAHHPPKIKRKQVKWFIILMNPCQKKERRGEDDRSKNINDGQVSLFTHEHGQSIWMAWLFRDICLNLQDKWKKISIYLCYHTKERDLALRESYTMSIQSLPCFENLKSLQTPRRKTCINFCDQFWGSIDKVKMLAT